jgi:hypothetical protein
MRTRFKSSRVQRFKVLGMGFVLTLELLNPLNLERASGQTPFYQGKTVRIIFPVIRPFWFRICRVREA